MPPSFSLISATLKKDVSNRAATRFAAGDARAGGLVSARAIALTQKVLLTMMTTKLKIGAALVLSLGLFGGSGGYVYLSQAAEQPAPADKAKDDKEAPPKEAAPPDEATKLKEAANRTRSSGNLRKLALAMHKYNDANTHFPAQAVYDAKGKPLLSWRVTILPYIDQEALYKEFNLDETWDSDHNKKLLEKMPPLYDFGDEKAAQKYETHYQGFNGKKAFFNGPDATRINDIVSGMSQTIMLVEAKKAVPWSKPEDVAFDAGKLLPKIEAPSNDGFLAALCDGSVLFFPLVKEDVLRNWIMRDSWPKLDLDK
jgi:Protein of unknown function (DUF1559)